jgi:hypothetical protein
LRDKLSILRQRRNNLLEQWRTDRKRRIEILAQIMDIDFEISQEMEKEVKTAFN